MARNQFNIIEFIIRSGAPQTIQKLRIVHAVHMYGFCKQTNEQ